MQGLLYSLDTFDISGITGCISGGQSKCFEYFDDWLHTGTHIIFGTPNAFGPSDDSFQDGLGFLLGSTDFFDTLAKGFTDNGVLLKINILEEIPFLTKGTWMN